MAKDFMAAFGYGNRSKSTPRYAGTTRNFKPCYAPVTNPSKRELPGLKT